MEKHASGWFHQGVILAFGHWILLWRVDSGELLSYPTTLAVLRHLRILEFATVV